MLEYDVNDLIKVLLNYDLADADFDLINKLVNKIISTIDNLKSANTIKDDTHV